MALRCKVRFISFCTMTVEPNPRFHVINVIFLIKTDHFPEPPPLIPIACKSSHKASAQNERFVQTSSISIVQYEIKRTTYIYSHVQCCSPQPLHSTNMRCQHALDQGSVNSGPRARSGPRIWPAGPPAADIGVIGALCDYEIIRPASCHSPARTVKFADPWFMSGSRCQVCRPLVYVRLALSSLPTPGLCRPSRR